MKELGTEQAIVFYEGLRPIRCRKIRYFADRRFRKRLLPATERHPCRSDAGVVRPCQALREPPSASLPPRRSAGALRRCELPRAEKEEVVIRDATVEDIERIESLTLEDFATDFSKVPDPGSRGPAFGARDEGGGRHVPEFARASIGEAPWQRKKRTPSR